MHTITAAPAPQEDDDCSKCGRKATVVMGLRFDPDTQQLVIKKDKYCPTCDVWEGVCLPKWEDFIKYDNRRVE